MVLLDTLPSKDTDLEEAVLGALILESNSHQLINSIQPFLFFSEPHKVVFSAIRALHSQGTGIDMRTVVHELRKTRQLESVGGAHFIAEMTSRVSSAAHLSHHVAILRQLYLKREAQRIGQVLAAAGNDDSADPIEIWDAAKSSIDHLYKTILTPGENSQTSLTDFEPYRITESTPIQEPVPIVKIGEAIICTPADLTAISGPSKTGKTAITQLIIAGSISLDGVILDPIEEIHVAANPDRKAVIHIDTEQARWKHQKNIKGILDRASLTTCPDHLLSYNVRQLPLDQYQPVTLAICKLATEKFGGIQIIIVDGIADYIDDVNEAAQANAIVKTFEELAIQHNCPVITVIHVNPGGDKERGHLGSQCQRKAGSVLTVKKDGEVSSLEPKLLRYAGNADVPIIQFQYERSRGYHVSAGTRPKEAASKKKVGRNIAELKTIAKKSYPPPNGYKDKDGLLNVIRESGLQTRAARDLNTEIKAHGFITKSGKLWGLNIELVQ